MDSADGEEIFLTQSKTCAENEVYDPLDIGLDRFIYPEVEQFCQESLSDEELSQFVSNAINCVSVPAYEDISSASDEEQSIPLPSLSSSRFKPPQTEEAMKEYGRRSLANSTNRKCKWAADLFNTWRLERNKFGEIDPNISVIRPCLIDMTKDEVCYSVSRFLCEVRKVNGEDYPSATLYEIVISLQLHLELYGKYYKLLQDEAFLQLKNTLDHVMKEYMEQGVAARNRKAEVISLREEDLLWKTVLGSCSPRKLVDIMLYLNGLNFALRAGAEHRNLRWEKSQLCVMTDSRGLTYLRYTEDSSKNNQGGLKHRRNKPKVVYAYANPNNPERCIVSIFQLYDSHCPKDRSAFYLWPVDKPTLDGVWFINQPIGIRPLTGTVARLCNKAGIPGFRTNHSLRATAATRMYEADVDEQLICEVTGHRSTAVREYKRTNDAQRYTGSRIVPGREAFDHIQPEKKARLEEYQMPNITVGVNLTTKSSVPTHGQCGFPHICVHLTCFDLTCWTDGR